MRGLCLPTNGRTVSISTASAGPTGQNGSPPKRRAIPPPAAPRPPCAAAVAGTIAFANFLSVSISAQTRVVAGSMYPPKIIGLTGAPALDADRKSTRPELQSLRHLVCRLLLEK